VETGIDYKTYAGNFDTISICLSKGLGAPVGSLLLCTKEQILNARRIRKVFGGGMRQAGIIAAAGLYALKNNINRLKIDHLHAKLIAETLSSLTWVKDVVPVETNIIVAVVKDDEIRNRIIEQLKANKILCMPFGPGMIRFVTHLDIGEKEISILLDCLKKLN
jgi:threonine aldolase